MAEILQTKSVYTLQDPVWIRNAGLPKGLDHDKQPLGIILAPGTTIRLRQISPGFASPLRLGCFGDGTAPVQWATVGSTWVDLTLNATLVPFVVTPYEAGTPVIEFGYPSTSKVLPIHRAGNSQDAFFAVWDAQDAEFGLIEGDYLRMLVPARDKAVLRAYPGGLSALGAYYQDLLTSFNALMGVSFQPERPTDLNVRSRYYLAADDVASDTQPAYYGLRTAATTSASVEPVWLDRLPTSWNAPNVIAGGYQRHFSDNRIADPNSVWGNVFAATWQDFMMGAEVYTEGWLYQGAPALFASVMALLRSDTPYESWDVRAQVYFVMLLKYKAGDAAISRLNQQDRIHMNTPPFPAIRPAGFDELAAACAERCDVDITPFLGLAGAPVTPLRAMLNVFSHARAVYPLCELVTADTLPAVQSALHLDSPLRLVDTVELQGSGITGSLSLRFLIDEFKQIYGEPLVLMEGAREVLRIPVRAPEMILDNLPIGAYTIRPPTGKNRKYLLDADYLVVKEGAASQSLTYIFKRASGTITQTLVLLSAYAEVSGRICVDFTTMQVRIDVTAQPLHAGVTGIYAAIGVKNGTGDTVYTREINNQEAAPVHDAVPFEIGHRLEVFVTYANLLAVEPPTPGLLPEQQSHALTITALGLQNAAASNNPEADLLARIAAGATIVREHLPMAHAPYAQLKDDLYLAVMALPTVARTAARRQYMDVMSTFNFEPDDYVGNLFTLTMKGMYNMTFITVTIDLHAREVRFRIVGTDPHPSFSNTYGYVSFSDVYGNEIFSYDFIGTRVATAMNVVFPLSPYGGERYYSFKEEASVGRYPIENVMQGQVTSGLKNMMAEVLPDGLITYASPSEISATPTVRGNMFLWSLLDASGAPVATLNLSLVFNTLTVTVPAGTHEAGLRVSVHVEDKYQQVVYDLDVQGSAPVAPAMTTFALQKGYTVTVLHNDPSRSQLVNTETNARTTVGELARYQTMPRGLKAMPA
ncbi:putative mucin/carbohydrate-binding domain-containing protein [Cupriavidus sp. 2KB_3]|uniref:putative mucin/carbohydrate-binding domain-containing protein n=1 Tax=Cupriavidus sp. 2KB_3 TaxID=3232980 RepID=UPI003F8FE834